MKLLLLSLIFPIFTFASSRPPKLLLVISVDQLRADYLPKFSEKFLPARKGGIIGGFNYLMERGAYFSHAEYGLLQNMTGPGHATILTGAYAYQHGIPNNDWVDAETQKYVYCAEDQHSKTVGASPSNPHVGTSPKNLLVTTLGDELKNAYPKSKVVALSLKDRSAIMMGGHRADLAVWFDAGSFSWVSSEFYLPEKKLPEWLMHINQSLKEKVGSELVWEKSLQGKPNPNSLVPESKSTAEMGKHFPHKGKVGAYSSLLFPLGVELPTQLALSALKEMKLGQGKAVDLLAVSYSSHDYVGHTFGTESDEIAEVTLMEDRALSELFNHIDKEIPGGLENTWIILTADHGVSDNPLVLQANKIPAGYIDQAPILQEMENYLNRRYGKSKTPWINEPSELNFYFNHQLLKTKKLEAAKIQTELVKHIQTKPELLKGIAYVFSGQDVLQRTLPPEQHERQILRTYVPGRSGDIMMVPRPNFIMKYGATTHMSGYSYDRYVPVIFAGTPFKPGHYAGGKVVDIAPTLSFLLGIVPPSGSEGDILEKALNRP